MPVVLKKIEVGPWPMNAYLLFDEDTGACAIVDPGAEAEKLLAAAGDAQVDAILITHGHPDHVGALEEVRAATEAPVYIHPADAQEFGLSYDRPLEDGLIIRIGHTPISAIHAPGHTPGMTCLALGEQRVLVGDAVFVGGPGKTWSPEGFARTMESMQNIIFAWPDATQFFPGHGPSGTIGQERRAFETFLERGWPADLFGDVTWEGG